MGESLGRVLLWYVWMVFHLVRDLRRGSWFHSIWHKQVRGCFCQHHASHRHSGLVYLPSRLFLRISHGQCRGCHSEFGVQPCRFREQDCFLPCHLEFCQEMHLGKGRCGPPPLSSVIDVQCRTSKSQLVFIIVAFQVSLEDFPELLSSPFPYQ